MNYKAGDMVVVTSTDRNTPFNTIKDGRFNIGYVFQIAEIYGSWVVPNEDTDGLWVDINSIAPAKNYIVTQILNDL